MAQDPKLFRGRRARQVSRAQGGEMVRVILIRQFTELVGTYVSRFSILLVMENNLKDMLELL
jgi:hypothetical protein